MSRTRLNIFIEPEHAKRLDQLAVHKGVSKSAIIAAALASFLSPDGGDQREAAMAKRLDRLSRQFDRLERDQNILIETVALYVRYFLTVSIPVPEGHQDAARAQGRARYAQFIEQLARHLQRGRSLVQEVHEDLGAGSFAEASASAAAASPASSTAPAAEPGEADVESEA
ncbi:MAG: CopG family transcriptional regulator [Acidovorax temperans]|uniref:CopG family transcriptional regulator n=1 Tax=Acidovorax temperans TaxID=80878 RepID=UPI00391A3BD9